MRPPFALVSRVQLSFDAESSRRYVDGLEMRFRITEFQSLLCAALMLGFSASGRAQSAGHILFSTPEGQISSNVPLPMVRAPQPRQVESLPEGVSQVPFFSDPGQATELPAPPQGPPPNVRHRDDFLNPMDVRQRMGVQTAAEIMDVPTAEQIFGLPDRAEPDAERNPFLPQDAVTNVISAALGAKPNWTILDTPDDAQFGSVSNATGTASGFFSGLFDTTRRDNLFGGQYSGQAATIFHPPQPDASGQLQEPQLGEPQQRQQWDSALMNSFTPSMFASDSAQSGNGLSSPVAMSDSGLNSQSPFEVPKVRTVQTLPNLPSLPAVPGRITPPGVPQVPSWAPKPPPWTLSKPPLGTMQQPVF